MHAEAAGNVILEGKVKTPDFDAAWNNAHKIVKVDARSRRQNATPMEPRGGHAAYDAATGRVTLTCTTQMPHLTRTAICDVLGIPESDLRVIAPDVAADSGKRCRLPANMSCWSGSRGKLKSSVAWTEDRRENLIAAFHSRDQYITLEGAFDKNAKLLALKADIISNIGAYSCFPTTCGVEPLMAIAEMPGPYDVQQYQCLARGVITNTCTMAPYRGVSRPVITFTLERLMDKAARAVRSRPDRHPPAQPHRQISLQVRDRPRRIDEASIPPDPGDGGRKRIDAAGIPRAPEADARAQGPPSRHRLRHLLRADGLRQLRRSRRAAWRSRPAGKRSSSPSIHPVSSRRASAPRRTVRVCAPRLRRSLPTNLASRPK